MLISVFHFRFSPLCRRDAPSRLTPSSQISILLFLRQLLNGVRIPAYLGRNKNSTTRRKLAFLSFLSLYSFFFLQPEVAADRRISLGLLGRPPNIPPENCLGILFPFLWGFLVPAFIHSCFRKSSSLLQFSTIFIAISTIDIMSYWNLVKLRLVKHGQTQLLSHWSKWSVFSDSFWGILKVKTRFTLQNNTAPYM